MPGVRSLRAFIDTLAGHHSSPLTLRSQRLKVSVFALTPLSIQWEFIIVSQLLKVLENYIIYVKCFSLSKNPVCMSHNHNNVINIVR